MINLISTYPCLKEELFKYLNFSTLNSNILVKYRGLVNRNNPLHLNQFNCKGLVSPYTLKSVKDRLKVKNVYNNSVLSKTNFSKQLSNRRSVTRELLQKKLDNSSSVVNIIESNDTKFME